MNKSQTQILYAAQIIILGISTLTALSGHTNLAIAGIAVYLTSQHLIQGGS